MGFSKSETMRSLIEPRKDASSQLESLLLPNINSNIPISVTMQAELMRAATQRDIHFFVLIRFTSRKYPRMSVQDTSAAFVEPLPPALNTLAK